jgi:predicted MFS family arabinose efflux permease
VIAATNGLFSGGGFIGALAILYLAERFGRLRSIQIGAAFAILGGVLQCAAQSLAMFYAGRFL